MRKHVFGTIVLLMGLYATPAAAQLGPVNGDAEAGAQLYYDHGCYACHGFSGYGRKDLNNTGSPWLTNEEIFRAFLRAQLAAKLHRIIPTHLLDRFGRAFATAGIVTHHISVLLLRHFVRA